MVTINMAWFDAELQPYAQALANWVKTDPELRYFEPDKCNQKLRLEGLDYSPVLDVLSILTYRDQLVAKWKYKLPSGALCSEEFESISDIDRIDDKAELVPIFIMKDKL